MRDKLACRLIYFILNHVATKKYQSMFNIAAGLGMYTLENELIGLDKEKWSDPAKFGEYVRNNWGDFDDAI